MNEEQKDLIKGFIEENWMFFEHYIKEQLEQKGMDSQSADDVAIQAIDDLEQA